MNPPEQRVSLLALSQEALKNPSLTLETINHLSTHGALPDTIVHTLDGWLAGSAIVLEKDLLQRSDDRLRALLHFILNRKISVTDFVVESIVLPNGFSSQSNNLKFDGYNETVKGDFEALVEHILHKDIIGHVETRPISHSKEGVQIAVRAPQTIDINHSEIERLFKHYKTGGRTLLEPTSFIFFTVRFLILRRTRLAETRRLTLVQILLYWSAVTSSRSTANEYLHSAQDWAKIIDENRDDSMLGEEKFHRALEWLLKNQSWLLTSRPRNKGYCDDAMESWAGAVENRHVPDFKDKCHEMIKSMIQLFEETKEILKSGTNPRSLPSAPPTLPKSVTKHGRLDPHLNENGKRDSRYEPTRSGNAPFFEHRRPDGRDATLLSTDPGPY